MQRLVDKLILFSLCFLPLLWREEAIGLSVVAAFLSALVASSLGSILGERRFLVVSIFYCLLALWKKELLLFLAPVAYDCARQEQWQFRFLWFISLFAYVGMRDPGSFFTTLLFCAAGYLLNARTTANEKALGRIFRFRILPGSRLFIWKRRTES